MTQTSSVNYQSKSDHVVSEVLQNLAIELCRITNIDEAMEKILESALQIEGVDSGGIYLIDSETGTIELIHHIGLSEEFVNHTSQFEKGSPQSKLIHAGNPIYTSYDKLLEIMDGVREREGLSAIGVIPIISDEFAIGAMNVASHEWKSIPVSSRRTLEALASHIGPVIVRVKAEEKVRQQEILYRTLLNTTPDAVVVVDPNLEVVVANQKAAENHGVSSPENLLGISGLEMIDPLDHDKALAQVQLTIEKGSVNGFVYRLRRKDGSTYYGEISTGLVRKDNGEPQHLITITRDITERKRTEDALVESEERYRKMAETISDGLTIIEDGKVTFVNKQLCEILGYEASVLKNKNSFDIAAPEEIDRLIEVREQSVEQNTPLKELSFWVIRADGNRRFINNRYSQFQKSDGTFLRYIITTDRTEAQQTKAALLKLNLDLESSLQELHETQEQLVQAERLTLLGKLSAGIGHELRNPLGSMKNSVYFLRMVLDLDESDVKESLDILDTEIVTSEMIIGSLLDFTHPKHPTRKKVSIDDVLGDALSRVRLRPDIQIKLRIDSDIPTLLLDPVQISRVFMNMVRNGLQAMPDGGLLQISVKKDQENNIVISFEDTGIGIPTENLDRLFEPLFTTKAKGIGLGLAISKSFVEAHHGSIDVKSQKGKGTSIIVKLPLPEFSSKPTGSNDPTGRDS
jgi:PAS domain S-box-containing protein